MVYIRFVAESLGAKVDWNEDVKQVMILSMQQSYKEKNNVVIQLMGDSKKRK